MQLVDAVFVVVAAVSDVLVGNDVSVVYAAGAKSSKNFMATRKNFILRKTG